MQHIIYLQLYLLCNFATSCILQLTACFTPSSSMSLLSHRSFAVRRPHVLSLALLSRHYGEVVQVSGCRFALRAMLLHQLLNDKGGSVHTLLAADAGS